MVDCKQQILRGDGHPSFIIDKIQKVQMETKSGAHTVIFEIYPMTFSVLVLMVPARISIIFPVLSYLIHNSQRQEREDQRDENASQVTQPTKQWFNVFSLPRVVCFHSDVAESIKMESTQNILQS